jgi:hypothetical protein
MGRRARRRDAWTTDRLTPPPTTTQTARVRVSDEMWADFRQAIGDRHVSEALADYVEQEVATSRGGRAASAELLTAADVETALRRLEALDASCQRMTDRLRYLQSG